MRIDLEIAEQNNKKKVLHVLKKEMKLSGRLINKLKASGGILLNEKPIRTVDSDRKSVV